TLTGQQQVLSIGRQQRQFSESLRRAILARDQGCAAPGCHVVASLCELHHIEYWSRGRETSTDNGITLCSHHHKAVHVGQLTITRVDGEHRFVMHPLIDPTQRARKNYFFQSSSSARQDSWTSTNVSRKNSRTFCQSCLAWSRCSSMRDISACCSARSSYSARCCMRRRISCCNDANRLSVSASSSSSSRSVNSRIESAEESGVVIFSSWSLRTMR